MFVIKPLSIIKPHISQSKKTNKRFKIYSTAYNNVDPYRETSLRYMGYANELGEPAQIKNSRLHSIECACETWNELISGGWQIVTNKFQ